MRFSPASCNFKFSSEHINWHSSSTLQPQNLTNKARCSTKQPKAVSTRAWFLKRVPCISQYALTRRVYPLAEVMQSPSSLNISRLCYIIRHGKSMSAPIQPAESYVTKFAWTMEEHRDGPKKCTMAQQWLWKLHHQVCLNNQGAQRWS